MTKLNTLHSQLSALRRSRIVARWANAYSALLTAVAWLLAAIFVIDVTFEMDVMQRLIIMALGAAATVWCFRRLTLPFLGVAEDEIQLALMVERQHRISSDLVAAIEFEWPEAGTWGSRALEDAVIEKVAGMGRALNVFEGFSRRQMARRALAFFATGALMGAMVWSFPQYAWTFARRLCLRADHYPTATLVEHLVVNHQSVMQLARDGMVPRDIASPESDPVRFLIRCSGQLPTKAKIELTSPGGQERMLDLQRMPFDEREQRLKQALARLREGLGDGKTDLAGPWARELETLARVDAPSVADAIRDAQGDAARLKEAADQLEQLTHNWTGEANGTAVFAAELPRLVASVEYQIYAGDAWTEPASVDMIPLPAVELQLKPIPPAYARSADVVSKDTTQRQVSVLEGSQVQVGLRCTNRKKLDRAWLLVTSEQPPQRYQLEKRDQDGYEWSLADKGTPFALVTKEIRFDVQVTDADEMHLQTPIRGYVRLKADRPPVCSATIVHRVVLPTAKPKITCRANDDFGIAGLNLRVEIERGDVTGEPAATEEAILSLLNGDKPLLGTQLPVDKSYPLELASLRIGRSGGAKPANLRKGDRLKITLEAVDYRGELPGESYLSDPLVLEISDESGVLAAISEADERSEQRITDIIKQQLGIGGTR